MSQLPSGSTETDTSCLGRDTFNTEPSWDVLRLTDDSQAVMSTARRDQTYKGIVQTTDHEMFPTGLRGWACLARCCGLRAMKGTTGLLLVGTTDYSNILPHKTCTHQALRLEQPHSVNVCRLGSSNSSFTSKSCACAYVLYIAGIISWSVDSTSTDTIASVLVITVTTVEANSDTIAYALKPIITDTCL